MEEQNRPNFDSIKQINVYGIEYWSARDLMPLLGYGNKWQNFENVMRRQRKPITLSATKWLLKGHEERQLSITSCLARRVLLRYCVTLTRHTMLTRVKANLGD
jgi:hypothetical protein